MDKDLKEMFREKNKMIIISNLKYDLEKNINSLLDTITDKDVREATHDEKLELIEKEFTWGNVIKIHCIGEYQIVEYIDKRDKKTYYHGYINYSDTNHSYLSLDSALIGCIGYKHEGGNGKAAMYFEKMIGL